MVWPLWVKTGKAPTEQMFPVWARKRTFHPRVYEHAIAARETLGEAQGNTSALNRRVSPVQMPTGSPAVAAGARPGRHGEAPQRRTTGIADVPKVRADVC